MDKNCTLATALHSWGNQCIKCKCGCGREFSYQRLQQEGIHGALVYMANNFPRESLRHLSPQEMALLTGFPRDSDWDGDQRMLTAGVGQLASSIQSAWIAAQIKKHLQEGKFIDCETVNPRCILAKVCLATIDLQKKWMGSTTTIEMDLFRENFEKWLYGSPKSVAPIHEGNESRKRDNEHDNNGLVAERPTITAVVDEPPKLNSTIGANDPQDGQDGLSQELANEISQIEFEAAKKGEIKFGILPCNPQTGGVHAFATPKETEKLEVSSQNKKHDIFEDPVFRDDSIVVDDEQKSQESSRFHQQIYQQVMPSEVINGKLIVFDHDENIFRTIQVSPKQTVGDLIQAEKLVHGEKYQVSTCLGRILTQEETIDQNIVVLHSAKITIESSVLYRSLQLQTKPRLESLLNQQGAVAVDEINFYLESLAKQNNMNSCEALVIESIQDLEHHAKVWFDKIQDHSKPVMTAVLVNHHWIPFLWVKQGETWHVTTNQEGENMWPQLNLNHQHQVFVQNTIESQFEHDCGFQVIAWFQSNISHDEPQGMDIARAEQLRQLFWNKLYIDENPEQSKCLALGGHNEELETALGAILREHGVFIERVQERAKSLILKLGSQAILSAIKSTRPWQSLKQLANEQSPTIRLVQEDEFQRVLQDRTKDGKPVKTKKMESKTKKPRQEIWHMTPQDVHIPDGVFGQSDGTVIGQLNIRQIHPKAKGVVLMTEQEWNPFRDQTVSSEGLAFLVMAPFSEETGKKGQHIRFPAQSTLTGEPILISAMLFQHGNKQVGRCQPAQTHSIEQIETQTIKVIVYRDQCIGEWKELVDKPIKYVLQYLECLQTCTNASCQCGKWHRDQDQDYDPIIDLWQRDFLTMHFQKAKQSEANVFTCLMRVVKSLFVQLSNISGMHGIYIEPRQQDGRKMDDSYHTIWLNKHSYETAQAVKATTPMTSSLVRVTNRFGLRVPAEQGPELHKFLKPDAPYIPGGERAQFVMGPLPFGTTKKAMSKLFEQWEWVAQPLHPCGRSQDHSGLMWLIAAASPPQHLVYTMAHGDVMITKEDAAPPKPISLPKIEASKFTKSCQQGESSRDFDPWAAAAKQLPSSASRISDMTQTQIAAVESRIESNILSKLPRQKDVDMGDSEPRIAALEAQMKEMQQAQHVCQEQTTRVAGKVDQLHHQMEAQATCFQNCLEQQMAEQMKRIESLLNKRKATE